MLRGSGRLIVPKWILGKMVSNFNWLSAKSGEETFVYESDETEESEKNNIFWTA